LAFVRGLCDPRGMAEFDFDYRLDEKEFVRAHRWHIRRSMMSGRNLFLLSMALAIGTVQARLFGGSEWVLGVFAFLWIAVVAFVLFAYVSLPRRLFKRSYDLPTRLRADSEGITVRTDESRSALFYPWEEIQRLTELDKKKANPLLLLFPKGQVP